MGKRKKHNGYSLVELVIVIIIIGILATVGVTFGSKQISKARMTSISSNLKIVANDIESAIVDLGFLDKTEVVDHTKAKNYLQTWDSEYLTSPLDLDSIVYVDDVDNQIFGDDFVGVKVTTKNYKDPWDNELHIFYMAPIAGTEYRIMIASAGPDGKFAAEEANGYVRTDESTGTVNYEDDVIMVMTPRR